MLSKGKEMLVIIIHDNLSWIQRLVKTCEGAGISVKDWFISSQIDDTLLQEIAITEPPEAIYLNRISSSSHYRGGRFAIEYVKQILKWLELHGRTIINGLGSLELEISKFYQYQELSRYQLIYPKTYLSCNQSQLGKIVTDNFNLDCLVKDNRSGSGLSVTRITNQDDLHKLIETYDEPTDGIKLVQQYILPKNDCIIRLEFVNYQFVYAVRVNNVGNNFHLCPADKCNLVGNKFEVIPDFRSLGNYQSLITSLEKLCHDNQILICGIEFLEDDNDNIYVYDINTNTNYNSSAERRAGIPNCGNERIINLLQQLANV
jgi:hypothetical protein